MVRKYGFLFALILLAGCFSDIDRCQEGGASLLFLCDPGVEVDHGAKNLPAECLKTASPAYQFCTAEQEENPMLQYAWNSKLQKYEIACIPLCQSYHDETAWCYEPCPAADGQVGVYCIRNHGNQWLIDSIEADCPN